MDFEGFPGKGVEVGLWCPGPDLEMFPGKSGDLFFLKMEISILRRVFVFNPVVEPRTRLHVGEAPTSRKKGPVRDFGLGEMRRIFVLILLQSPVHDCMLERTFFDDSEMRRFFCFPGHLLVPPGPGGKRCAGFLC